MVMEWKEGAGLGLVGDTDLGPAGGRSEGAVGRVNGRTAAGQILQAGVGVGHGFEGVDGNARPGGGCGKGELADVGSDIHEGSGLDPGQPETVTDGQIGPAVGGFGQLGQQPAGQGEDFTEITDFFKKSPCHFGGG